MPRESTITFEQVAAAADAIKAEGGKANARAVRERLGTGSMGTIHRLLQQWQAGQGRQAEPALSLPPAVHRAILEFMSQELAAGRATLAADLAEQQQAATDLATENERQALAIDAQESTIADLQGELAAQGGRLAQVEADLTRARDEAIRERQGAELARTELAKAHLRLEAMPRLEADLVAAREALEIERTARTDAEKQAAVAVEKASGIEARLADLQVKAERETKARTEAEKQAAGTARELADARVAVQAAQVPLEAAAREIADLKKAVGDARAAAKTAGEEAAELRGRLGVALESEGK
jgi:hypothetical protein